MSGTVRARLAADANAQAEKISSTLMDALEATTKKWAFCPDCRKKVQVDHPDHNAQLKAAEMLLEQGFGRVGADAGHKNPEVAGAEVTMATLESMSMTQLSAFVWLNTTDEERERDRRFVEAVGGRSWPAGFGEALFELQGLIAKHQATAVAV